MATPFSFIASLRKKKADTEQDALSRYRAIILAGGPTPKQADEIEKLIGILGFTPDDVEHDMQAAAKMQRLESAVRSPAEVEKLRLKVDEIATQHDGLTLKHFEEREDVARKLSDASSAYQDAARPANELQTFKQEIRTGTRYARIFEVKEATPEPIDSEPVAIAPLIGAAS